MRDGRVVSPARGDRYSVKKVTSSHVKSFKLNVTVTVMTFTWQNVVFHDYENDAQWYHI